MAIAPAAYADHHLHSQRQPGAMATVITGGLGADIIVCSSGVAGDTTVNGGGGDHTGGTSPCGLRIGEFRATYEIDGTRIAVKVLTVGATPACPHTRRPAAPSSRRPDRARGCSSWCPALGAGRP